MEVKMNRARWICLALVLLLALIPASALAANYLFSLDELHVNVFLNADGSTSIDYLFVFTNAPGASPIDYVDVGMPNGSFSMSGVTADANGAQVSVSRSDYAGEGSGFAIVMGSQSIRPGETGRVHVYVPDAGSWLRTDSKDPNYASINFSPTWFGKEFVQGDTNMSITFHLPPGVQPEEPRWHSAPSGFSAEPLTGVDAQGRITYTWTNQQAQGYRQYEFGASFPSQYVPAGIVTQPTFQESTGINTDNLFGFFCCFGVGAIIFGSSLLSVFSANRRKMQYLPPKIAVEGLGIKRGLTAVEAAVLMEQPLDKVLTMILFGVIKKEAASVVKQDPLEIQAARPAPEGLFDYEKEFLQAFATPAASRKKALQEMMINLVKSLSAKMKGFSRNETVAYYKDIMERAWAQVEAAQTPEVKSETYDKYMEWTMLDKDYDERTRRVFTGPVFVPTWWGRYDPTFSPSTVSSRPTTVSQPSAGGGQGSFSLPSLPGSAFAASVVNGVQGFSSGVVGNVSEFTSAITNKTNPVPVATRSGGSGRSGGGCACACACAGCACACAGGGR
jgi:hypothetical protein